MTNFENFQELIMKHEELILKNRFMIEEFMARYDRDRIECSARYKEEREEAKRWREQFDGKLNSIDTYIQTMKPNYRFAVYLMMTAIVSALALIFKTIWFHVQAK